MSSGFKAKLDNFQQRFKNLLGAKAQVGRAKPGAGRDRRVEDPLTSLPPWGLREGRLGAAGERQEQGAGPARLLVGLQ